MEKDASLRRHIGPRLSILLGQHKRHEIDFVKSPGAHDTIVTMSIVFFIVRARKESSRLGWRSLGNVICAHEMFYRCPYSSFLDTVHE